MFKRNKQNVFNSIPVDKPRMNTFDLSHDVKMSMNMGYLVPCQVQEAIPTGRYSTAQHSLVRLAPMVAPIMHNVNVYYHNWFVPYRLLWYNWEKWYAKEKVGGVLPTFPTINILGDGSNYTKLSDYLGVPSPLLPVPSVDQKGNAISAMIHAAYQFIYNEMYRDQNMIDPVTWELNDGDNSSNPDLFILRRRAWQHDYFTSNLPFAQKGEAVQIPLGTFNDVPVVGDDDYLSNPWKLKGESPLGTPQDFLMETANPSDPTTLTTRIFARTSLLQTMSATINSLRRAFSLQRYAEKKARGGTRYAEILKTLFGANPGDARLQRPEYIGGSRGTVKISEVLSTVENTDAGLPQGNMAGHGLSVTTGGTGSYVAQEHGVIITIMSIMPDTAYMQGTPKHFTSYHDPTDMFTPDLANIGEEAVTLNELFSYSNNQDETFGYLPRYSSYRYTPSRVAGDFRGNLLHWHMGRVFTEEPTLSKEFIECDATQRIFAVEDPDVDKIYCHVFNSVRATLPIPLYGNPI